MSERWGRTLMLWSKCGPDLLSSVEVYTVGAATGWKPAVRCVASACVSYCRLQIELLILFYLLHGSACIFTAEDWDFFIANITWKTKKMQQQWRCYSLATHHSTYYCPGMKSYFTTCVCLWWLSDYTFRCVHMYVHLPVWCTGIASSANPCKFQAARQFAGSSLLLAAP